MRKTHLQKQFTALVLILSFLGVNVFAQDITAGTNFNICGRAASGIYATRPTNASFTTGTGELVTDIVSTSSAGTAIDFDGDGYNEVVLRTIGTSGTSSTQTRVYIFEASANNNFIRRASITIDQGNSAGTPGLSKGLDVGNIDGDSDFEIVAFSGVSSSTFLTAYDVNSSFGLTELAQSRLYGFTGSTDAILINGNFNGTVNTVKIVPNKNGNSNNDILISNATGTTSIPHLAAVEFNDASAFTYLSSGAMVNYNNGIFAFNVADMDNDGNLEVIMVCETTSAGSLKIREYVTSATASERFGTTDLTITGNWNHGTGSGVAYSTVDVGDIDGDGDIDAIVPDNSHTTNKNLRVVTFDGSSYVATVSIGLGTIIPIAVSIADLDQDGRKEIIYTRNDAGVTLREHDGTANNFATSNFVGATSIITGLTGGNITAVAVNQLTYTADKDNNYEIFLGRGTNNTDTDLDGDELFVVEVDRFYGGGNGFAGVGTSPITVTSGDYDNLVNENGTSSLSGSVNVYGNLNFSSGILSIGSNTLTLAGTVSRTSGFLRGNYNNSNLVIQGSTAKTLFFDQTTDGTHLDPTTGTNAINNLTLSSNGNLVIGNKLNLFGTLTTAAGTTLDMGEGIFVFRNTATTTARIGDLTAGAGTITGSPIAEIYIHEGRRAWRLLTNPTVGGTIANNWQNDFGYAGGYGTNIYGPSGTTGMNSPATPQHSMMKFNSNLNTTGGYDNVTNTGDNLDGTYFIYVRGDKTVAANPGGAANPFVQTTLASKGTIRTGTQTISLNFLANRYGAIANPYLSPVDLNLVTFNGIAASNAVYSWDPSLNTQGGWVTLNSTNSYASGNYTKDMQIGQAGLVLMDGSSTASVEFNENDKSSAKATAQTGVGNGLQDNLRTTLRIVNADGSKLLADEMFVAFKNGFNPNFDNKEDAIKMINGGENISSKRNNTLISVEARPYIQNADTIFMNFTNNRVANYEFTFNPSNFDATVTSAKLVDKFLNTETPISLSANTTVPFSITSTTGSNAADRFMIVFEGTGALPNKNFTVTGEKLGNNKVKINWEAQAETGVREYTLQRSADGTNYTNINTQTAKNGNATQVYNYTDNEAKAGVNYYRVKTTQLNDIERYSQVITLNIKHSTSNTISVFPNPVKGNTIGLQLQDLEKGIYSVRILSVEGKEVYKQQLQVSGSNLNTTINPTTKLASGTYTLQVVGKNNSYTSKLLVD